MSALAFTLRLASGEAVRGINVHGNGGPIAGSDGPARLRLLIDLATAGAALRGVYEPAPGHVRAYRHTAAGDVDERVLDLRGAELLDARR